jgi:hypothetical protein
MSDQLDAQEVAKADSRTIGLILIAVGILVAVLGIISGILIMGIEATQGVVKVSNALLRAAEGIGLGAITVGVAAILMRRTE